MAVESAGVKVPFVVKGEKTERGPGDMDRLAVLKLYDDIDHSHSGPGEAGEAEALRIAEHPLELGARQTKQTVVLIKQKHAARQSHYVPAQCGPTGARRARR